MLISPVPISILQGISSLKSAEARLLAAITAEVDVEPGSQLPKIDMRQAFLYGVMYGDMEHHKVYIQPHDSWPDSILKSMFTKLLKKYL